MVILRFGPVDKPLLGVWPHWHVYHHILINKIQKHSTRHKSANVPLLVCKRPRRLQSGEPSLGNARWYKVTATWRHGDDQVRRSIFIMMCILTINSVMHRLVPYYFWHFVTHWFSVLSWGPETWSYYEKALECPEFLERYWYQHMFLPPSVRASLINTTSPQFSEVSSIKPSLGEQHQESLPLNNV